ncbi:MAG: hypothetical protein MJ223_02840 [Mycoplasmoidaceae bacterium]|nr:hypothetical protein [Mycoplasmoidaceae bacterium]
MKIEPEESSQLANYQLVGVIPEWLHIDYDGFLTWDKAIKGSYTFQVKATSIVDDTISVTSQIIALNVGVNPNGGLDSRVIIGICCGCIFVVGLAVALGMYAHKRRKR